MDSYRPTKQPRSPLEKLILFASGFLGLLFIFWTLSVFKGSTSQPLVTNASSAVVVLSGDSDVTGTIAFHQLSRYEPVVIRGHLKGLDRNALRGFHIHQFGDLTNGCLSAGPHYNPLKRTHGAPDDKQRHVGDLGNIETNVMGEAIFTFQDSQISLNGPLSIIGRAVVIHSGTDDLGRGGNDESLKTGNAGGRAACGIIGISSV